MRIPSLGVALAAFLVFAPAAHAQFAVTVLPSIIGNTIGNMTAADSETACMTGALLPQREIFEARDPSTVAMQQYFRAAQGGGDKSAAFHLDDKARWSDGNSNSDMTNLDAVVDPLAAQGHVLAAKPLRFYRSYLAPAALGQWVVQDAQGAPIGVYTGLFVRKGGAWKLRSLTVSPSGSKVEPAMPFCRTPGDVTDFRVKFTRQWREQTEKRLAKARIRQEAAESRAKAGEAAGNATLASVDRKSANLAAKEVTKLEAALIDARKAEGEALENVRSVERLTVDVGEAMTLATTS
jgi:hypothetical protein